ncbi:cobyrinate a,c-diamide synthase [Flexithrix dorotheae]|uniref:cobyrinate a,c-diamide synthase n=1 Tax=Flexithrix dorotheae TaxID=70993 RepID=UPI00037F1B29|nr:cobyrinate a,c-diamide synthase [Flexithrix dorotheae]
MQKPQFLIGAAASGSGKTTFTLGLLHLLKTRGLKVQPYKCGPDYLDVKHHTLAAEREGINLDTFMCSAAYVQKVYAKYLQEADAAIIEGVMGLFDGAKKMQGSSAEIALLLKIPVVLLLDARAMAYSAAPILFGFKNFHPELNLKGVVFNFVNSEGHYNFLKDACQDVGVTALGYIPNNPEISIEERHLGLKSPEESNWRKRLDSIATHIAKTVDIDQLLSLTTIPAPRQEENIPLPKTEKHYKIAIARDEAFNFTYLENINALRQLGKVTYFSPLHDERLPETDFLYLAGGYPELYLKQLSENQVMKSAIKNYLEKGGKCLAECGGLMYLGKSIKNNKGKLFPMVNFLEIETSMEKPQLHLGYRKFHFKHLEIRGHEFHFSRHQVLSPASLRSIGLVKNANDLPVKTQVYYKNKTMASYIHFYWGQNPSLLTQIIENGAL